jgi:6-phosphofructokinase 1
MNRRIGILTGGGDVPPLNAVIAAVRQACLDQGVALTGFLKGWQGAVENQHVDLSSVSVDPLIGGTILKSSRMNLAKVQDGIPRVKETLQKLGVDGLIVIGGEDTLSNCYLLRDFPQILISKTIDNDVGRITYQNESRRPDQVVNYFTLGFPTAARKIASFVSLQEGLRTTAYSHERLIVVESMGMHAGWLALASAMGHPDFIIIPEFPLDYDAFRASVAETYRRNGNVIVVIAEGARWKDGSSVSADQSEHDDFGHPRFRGSAETLAGKLKDDLKNAFNVRNVNAVNPSYLYRSGKPSDLDLQWAENLGKAAVSLFSRGLDEPILLTVEKDGPEFRLSPYPVMNHQSIEELHRFIDGRFYDPGRYSITAAGKAYLSAIVDEMPSDGSYGLRP